MSLKPPEPLPVNRSRAHEGTAALLDVGVLDLDDQVGIAVAVVVDRGDADGQVARGERQAGGRAHRAAGGGEHHVEQAVVGGENEVGLAVAVEVGGGDRVGLGARGVAVAGRRDHRRAERAVAGAGVNGDGSRRAVLVEARSTAMSRVLSPWPVKLPTATPLAS